MCFGLLNLCLFLQGRGVQSQVDGCIPASVSIPRGERNKCYIIYITYRVTKVLHNGAKRKGVRKIRTPFSMIGLVVCGGLLLVQGDGCCQRRNGNAQCHQCDGHGSGAFAEDGAAQRSVVEGGSAAVIEGGIS